MIRRLLSLIKFLRNPPKTGDCYYGDPFDFVIGSLVEHTLHGTRNICGDAMWEPIPSMDCYKMTIKSCQYSYYVCESEVLCKSLDGDHMEWKIRSQPRRLSKKFFKEMVVDGRLRKNED